MTLLNLLKVDPNHLDDLVHGRCGRLVNRLGYDREGERDDALLEVGSFRAQIAALKGAERAKK